MLTESGAWKLAGLGLAVRAQFAGSTEAATLTFDYSNPSPPSALQLTQVSLTLVIDDSLVRSISDARFTEMLESWVRPLTQSSFYPLWKNTPLK